MAPTDSESDAPNPSKSFNAGAADRLSGFFTPVWESKRRRAEGERPSSRAPSKPGKPSRESAAPPAIESEKPRATMPLPGSSATRLTPADGIPATAAQTSAPPAAAPLAEELGAPVATLVVSAAAALQPEPKAAPATLESPIAASEQAANEQATNERAGNAAKRTSAPAAGSSAAPPAKSMVPRPANTPATDAGAARRLASASAPLATRAPAPEAAAPAAREGRWRTDSPVPEARRIVAAATRQPLAPAASANAASSDYGVPQEAPGSEADWDSPDTLPKPFASGESPTPEARLSHVLRRLRRTVPLYTALPERVRKLVDDESRG